MFVWECEFLVGRRHIYTYRIYAHMSEKEEGWVRKKVKNGVASKRFRNQRNSRNIRSKFLFRFLKCNLLVFSWFLCTSTAVRFLIQDFRFFHYHSHTHQPSKRWRRWATALKYARLLDSTLFKNFNHHVSQVRISPQAMIILYYSVINLMFLCCICK